MHAMKIFYYCQSQQNDPKYNNPAQNFFANSNAYIDIRIRSQPSDNFGQTAILYVHILPRHKFLLRYCCNNQIWERNRRKLRKKLNVNWSVCLNFKLHSKSFKICIKILVEVWKIFKKSWKTKHVELNNNQMLAFKLQLGCMKLLLCRRILIFMFNGTKN